jgi:hypothetical protein
MNNDLMQMQLELNIEKKWDTEILKFSCEYSVEKRS